MSVAVFSRDAVLARMLLLEALRCGLQEVQPAHARVWLVDLDHPVALPKGEGAPLQIGFSAQPENVKNTTRSGLYALLPLPFCARELGEILHRREHVPTRALLREGDALWLAGRKLSFSKTEQKILKLLCENASRTVQTREIEAILGDQAEKSNAVAVYLYRLRRKLEQDGVTRICTVRGVGYRWIGE
jgi:hypothetical protein